MNGFVNPYQRGFDLPEGCKDLIDVLRLPPQPEPVAASEGFADVERYISRCADSKYKNSGLFISCRQKVERMSLFLIRANGVLYAIIDVDCTNSLREQIVRAIFAERGIALSHRPQIGFLIYPLPRAPRDAAALVIDLLQRAYRLPEGASLDFRLSESDIL